MANNKFKGGVIPPFPQQQQPVQQGAPIGGGQEFGGFSFLAGLGAGMMRILQDPNATRNFGTLLSNIGPPQAQAIPPQAQQLPAQTPVIPATRQAAQQPTMGQTAQQARAGAPFGSMQTPMQQPVQNLQALAQQAQRPVTRRIPQPTQVGTGGFGAFGQFGKMGA